MPSSSQKYTGTVTTTAFGTIDWTNAGNVTVSDNTYASCVMTTATSSYRLKCTNFGFSIPSGATITGISISVERYSASSFNNISCFLVKGGVIQGNGKADTTTWAASDEIVNIGDSKELWNDFTLTDTDINNSGFGVTISVSNNTGGSATAYIDSVAITVYYLTGDTIVSSETGTGADDATVGSVAWTSPTNVQGTADGVFATCSSNPSHYLKCTNFGFTIPYDATVNGITVSINRKKVGGTAGVRDTHVEIVKRGTIGSTNLANTLTTWPTTLTVQKYGGPANLWGETWTPANINRNDFGVVLSTQKLTGKGTPVPTVDNVSIDIDYTESSAVNTGFQAPSSVVGDSAEPIFGNYPWVNESNAITDDASYASADGTGDSGTIISDGDENAGGGQNVVLIIAGDYSDMFAPASTAVGETLPTFDSTIMFGGPTDKWNTGGLTASQVKASDFGVVYSCYSIDGGLSSDALMATGFDFSAIGSSDTIDGIAMTVKRYRVGPVAYVNAIRVNVYYTPSASGPANMKTVVGLAKASVKTVDGLAIASVKTINGLA